MHRGGCYPEEGLDIRNLEGVEVRVFNSVGFQMIHQCIANAVRNLHRPCLVTDNVMLCVQIYLLFCSTHKSSWL